MDLFLYDTDLHHERANAFKPLVFFYTSWKNQKTRGFFIFSGRNKVVWNGLIQKQPPEVFYKKGVLRIFTKFTGKHPAALLKERPWNRCFPVNSVKFLRTLFYRTPLVAASGGLWEMSCRKDVFKNYAVFPGKLRVRVSQQLYLKKGLWHRVWQIPSEFCEIFKNTFFIGHLWWLLPF